MAQLSSSGLCPQDECERLEAHRRELFEMQTQGRTMECVDSGALSSPHWPHLLDFDKEQCSERVKLLEEQLRRCSDRLDQLRAAADDDRSDNRGPLQHAKQRCSLAERCARRNDEHHRRKYWHPGDGEEQAHVELQQLLHLPPCSRGSTGSATLLGHSPGGSRRYPSRVRSVAAASDSWLARPAKQSSREAISGRGTIKIRRQRA